MEGGQKQNRTFFHVNRVLHRCCALQWDHESWWVPRGENMKLTETEITAGGREVNPVPVVLQVQENNTTHLLLFFFNSRQKSVIIQAINFVFTAFVFDMFDLTCVVVRHVLSQKCRENFLNNQIKIWLKFIPGISLKLVEFWDERYKFHQNG